MTILVVFLLILSFWGDDILRLKPRWDRWKLSKIINELAKSKMDFMQFGKDGKIDEMIKFEAQAENWNFNEQDGFKLIGTGDFDTPFVTSVIYYFTDPNDKNRMRILSKTYVFDDTHVDWVPLTSRLQEFSGGEGKTIKRYSLWQGGFEISFFE